MALPVARRPAPEHVIPGPHNGPISIYSFADQGSSWSDAHGGFGVALASDRVQSVVGRSLRRTTHAYLVHGGGLAGNATVEGGMEMTAIENGTLLSSVRDKRFRSGFSSG